MKVTKFGDVVHEVKINVDRDNNPYEFYIAGDHMDSEDLTIHRKGHFATDDVGPAFTRIFKPGQILYGSRRTYLKKIAVADFEGICANTTFVLETKDNCVFLQSLLPFIMLSDKFTEWSVSHSKGSTNPYVLFSDLASYEFELPSLEEQSILSKKLWAAYRLKESYKRLLTATDEMVKSQFIEMFGNPVTNSKSWQTKAIMEVAPEQPSKKRMQGKVWLLNLDMIESNTGKVIEKVYETSENTLSVQPFDEGNVLFSKLRPYLNKVVVPDEYGLATTELVPLRPNQEKLHKVFLSYLLRSQQFVTFANKISGGTKMPRMPLAELRKFECILPPMSEQLKFVGITEQADKSKFVGFKSQFIEMFGGCANRIKLSSLCSTFVDGDWIESKDQSELGVRLIQTGNVGNGFFKDKEDKSRYISEETFDNLHCTEIYPGDILVSRLPDPIGRACIIPQGIGRTITAVDCTIIRLKDIILPDYFITYTMTPSYAAQINEVTTGTTRRRVSRANLGNILIPCPSTAKQQQFVAIAKQADKSKFELRKSIDAIDQVIKSLING